MSFVKKNWILLLAVTAFVLYFMPNLFGKVTGGVVQVYQPSVTSEPFCGDGCGGQCGNTVPDRETFSSCYQRKQIYLNSCDPDEPTGHADVNLEKRFGKFYITINANLPYAKGGVFNTSWGVFSAFLVDTTTNKSINIGSLVRHGDRFYKLSTELLGEYGNYDEMRVYQSVEDYGPKLKLRGSITGQSCSSL